MKKIKSEKQISIKIKELHKLMTESKDTGKFLLYGSCKNVLEWVLK